MKTEKKPVKTSLTSLALIFLRGPWELEESVVVGEERIKFVDDLRIFSQITRSTAYHRLDNHGHETATGPTIKSYPLPPQMWLEVYIGREVWRTRKDPADEELRYTFVGELKKLAIPADAAPKNKAIKALLDSLEDTIPVVLDWR